MAMIVDSCSLPCGCILRREINGGRRELLFIPCRPECRHLADALELAEETGTPVETRVGT